jgi:ribonuclease HII
MSVQEIGLLLEDAVLPPIVRENLKQDSRAGVARMLTRCDRRQAAADREQSRLEELHRYELELIAKGFRHIAGVDEAGRGPLAGPVVIAAVILPAGERLVGLDDSKKLSPRQRDALYTVIRSVAVGIEYCVYDAESVDRLNIYQATLRGMYDVLGKIQPAPDAALIDAMPLPGLNFPCRSLIHGDALSASIAAASIIAKVERDRIMERFDECYPQYGFCRHKGYATPEHLSAIEKHGPCPIHRKSFAPVKSWGTLFDEDQ